MSAKRTFPKSHRQEDIFKAIMLAMVMGIMEDFANNTDNHHIFFDTAMQACLTNGIPPEHQIAVMNTLTALVASVNIEIAKIKDRGISPN